MESYLYWSVSAILLACILFIIHRTAKAQKQAEQLEREEAEKLHEALEKMRRRRADLYRAPSQTRARVPAISTPIASAPRKVTPLPSRKIEQRTTPEHTTRAEDSGSHSMDGFAMGMLVGHMSNISNDDDLQSRTVFSSGSGGDFGGGGASSSYDSSSSSDSSSTSSSDDSSSSNSWD